MFILHEKGRGGVYSFRFASFKRQLWWFFFIWIAENKNVSIPFIEYVLKMWHNERNSTFARHYWKNHTIYIWQRKHSVDIWQVATCCKPSSSFSYVSYRRTGSGFHYFRCFPLHYLNYGSILFSQTKRSKNFHFVRHIYMALWHHIRKNKKKEKEKMHELLIRTELQKRWVISKNRIGQWKLWIHVLKIRELLHL